MNKFKQPQNRPLFFKKQNNCTHSIYVYDIHQTGLRVESSIFSTLRIIYLGIDSNVTTLSLRMYSFISDHVRIPITISI